MAVLTTCILVGLGATALVGTGAYLWTRKDVKAEELNNRLKEIENEINANNLVIGKYNTIKGKIQKAIKCLDDGKKAFANGGHIIAGVPLANAEISNTKNKLNQAITNVNNINNELNNNIKMLEEEKKQINSELAKLKN